MIKRLNKSDAPYSRKKSLLATADGEGQWVWGGITADCGASASPPVTSMTGMCFESHPQIVHCLRAAPLMDVYGWMDGWICMQVQRDKENEPYMEPRTKLQDPFIKY